MPGKTAFSAITRQLLSSCRAFLDAVLQLGRTESRAIALEQAIILCLGFLLNFFFFPFLSYRQMTVASDVRESGGGTCLSFRRSYSYRRRAW